jgi:hypothetical protein
MSVVPRPGPPDPATAAPLAFDPEPIDAPRWPDEVGAALRALMGGVGRVIDRQRPGIDPVVDHIVLSPAGLDIVQVRAVRGRVGLRLTSRQERALYVGADDRTAWLGDLDHTVAEIGDALGRSPLARVRRGWLCLDGADWHEVPVGVHLAGYPVLPPSLVRQFLPHTGPYRLAHITVAAERLEEALVVTRRRPAGRTSIRRMTA